MGLGIARPELIADLGHGVMDDDMVEAAAHLFGEIKMANKNQTQDPIKCWKIGEGLVDLKTVDVDEIKTKRTPDFEIIPSSFLATGIKADATEPLSKQTWLSAYEQGVEILVLVDGSGLFIIANMSAKTGFLYLKSVKQKARPNFDFTKAFVVMSMTDGNKDLDDIRDSIEQGVHGASSELSMPKIEVKRVDDREGSTYKIDEEIFTSLETCGLVVCDLTEEKPNCYYELAWAMAHQRPVIVTAKKGTKIHFDVSRFNIRFWQSQRELKEQIKKDAIAVFSEQRRATKS